MAGRILITRVQASWNIRYLVIESGAGTSVRSIRGHGLLESVARFRIVHVGGSSMGVVVDVMLRGLFFANQTLLRVKTGWAGFCFGAPLTALDVGFPLQCWTNGE